MSHLHDHKTGKIKDQKRIAELKKTQEYETHVLAALERLHARR